MFSNFFQKSCCLEDTVEELGGTWEVADGYNVVHAFCMLDD
jgi:hypothetical protein